MPRKKSNVCIDGCRLSRQDLDRFPGSLLHGAIEDLGDGADCDIIPVRNEAHHPHLTLMVFELYRCVAQWQAAGVGDE